MASNGKINNLGQKLLDLKERLEKEKNARLLLQGELKSLQSQLMENYSIKSLKEAENQIIEGEEKLGKLEIKIQDKIQEIKELMEEGNKNG